MGIISENVVVCMPFSQASLISAVRRFAPGTRRLMRVDFPTPLLPLSSVIFSGKSVRSSSTPLPVVAEICRHS